MSEKINNGGPAFPVIFYDRDSTGEYQPREQCDGMSLRDYFAAKAMQGLIFNLSEIKYGIGAPTLTKNAYIIADAMLAERNRR